MMTKLLPKRILLRSTKLELSHRLEENIQVRNLGITEDIKCVKALD